MEEDKEEEISRDELKKIIRKLKDGKATAGEGIPNEVWRGESSELAVVGLCGEERDGQGDERRRWWYR